MKKGIFKYSLMCLLCFSITGKSQEAPVLTFTIPTQNNLQSNQFLINPNFSLVRQDDTFITLYHRNQWREFNDAPSIYMISYGGRINAKSGGGLSIYQHNLGVITSFGGIGNYSYGIQLREDMLLAFGFNIAYYITGVNRNRTVTNDIDPYLLSLSNTSMITFKPAINLSWKSFDIGVYAENLVDYDFKSSEMVEEYSNKTFTGHLQYYRDLTQSEGMFANGSMRILLKGRINEIESFKYGGSLIVNYPSLGWVQTGWDDYFGVAIGVGAHLTKKVSLGYTYERVTKDGLVNLGPTHEVTLAYRIGNRINNASTPTIIQEMLQPTTVTSTTPAEENNPISTRKITTTTTTVVEEEILTQTVEKRPIFTTTVVKEYVTEERKAPQRISTKQKSEQFEQNKNINQSTLDSVKEVIGNSYPELTSIIEKEVENHPEQDPQELQKKVDEMMHYIERLEETIRVQTENNQDNELAEQNTETTTTENQITEKTNPNNLSNTTNDEKKTTTTSSRGTQKIPNQSQKQITSFALSDKQIEEFYSKQTSKKRQTAIKNYLEIPGQEPGYYIICNVFSDLRLAESFFENLKNKGMNPRYFDNPNNNYRYIYLKKFDKWEDAQISYYTNVDNTYFETIWIMNININ